MLLNWRSQVRNKLLQLTKSSRARQRQRRWSPTHAAQLTNVESLESRLLLTAEVRVVGNSIEIQDGDTTPSTADGTNFGTVFVGGATVAHSFTVFNDGDTAMATAALQEPAGYTIIDNLATSIPAGGSDVFTIRLDTNIAGSKTGQVTFSTNDPDETVFNFTIVGVVSARAPEITVIGNNVEISDGDITPSSTDGTDFGTTTQGGTGPIRIFTVRNDGTETLTLGALSVPTGFGISDGLVSSLLAGQSDTFALFLQTGTVGVKTGEVSFATNDTSENPFNFTITGTVGSAGADAIVIGNGLTILDGDNTPTGADGTDFGFANLGGVPISKVFTVRNDGTSDLTVSGLSVPTGFTITEDISATLAPGESDTFTITLETAVSGTKFGTVSFATNDTDENPYTFDIIGTVGGSGPEITVLGNGVNILDGDSTPSTLDGTNFGDVTQGGATASRSFLVRNDGTTALNLSNVVVPTGYTITDSLSATLAPGASDTLTIRLETGTVGTKSGQVTFVTNDSDENPFNFSITGVVSGPGPEVTVIGNGISILDGDTTPEAADSTDFGIAPVGGTPVIRTFIVRNDGTQTLTLSGLGVPTGYTITEGLSGSLAVGASDTFSVRLDTTTPGTKSGQISFANNDSNENPFNFSITGVVTAAGPEVVVTGNGANITDGDNSPEIADGTDYGTVIQGGTTVTRTFTVTNQGSAVLNLSGLVVPIGYTIVDGLAATLAVGASDTFAVRLDTTTVGTKSGQVTFTTNDADENPFNFTITGIVNAPGPEAIVLGNGIEISDGDSTPSTADGTDYGTLNQGAQSITRTFTVRNDGTTTLTLGSVSVPTGFTIVDSLVASLAPGEFDVFTVRFDTAVVGTKTGQISFATNDSNENPYNFTITGTIAGLGPEMVITGNGNEITDGDTLPNAADGTDFGTATQGGATISRTFTVSNTGTTTLTLGSVVLPAGYTLTEGLVTSLAPGSNDSFTVRLDTTTSGTKSGQISIANNDSDENPYNFAIVGIVNATGPEVIVFGNGIEIVDGDTTPSTADGTDFGTVALGSAPISRTYTVRNDGSSTLTLSNLAEPAGFSITDPLVASLAPGQSDSFTIRLDTTFAGTKTGQITFTNNDSNENPYNFTIIGIVGSGGPEVAVFGGGIEIPDGDTTPITTDGTDFGSISQGGTTVSRTFTVRNDGSSTLTLGALTVPTGYTVTNGLVASLAPGASDTVVIRLDSATAGTKTGDVSFTTNDSDENPFNFTIIGIVNAAGADVAVFGNGVSIVDGDTTPTTADDTDFGTVALLSSPVSHTFTVRNDGSSTLTLGNLTVPTGYSVTDPLVGSLAPGASDLLTIRLDTGIEGTKTGQVSFTTNDADENPFNFTITGNVGGTSNGPEVTVLGNGLTIIDGDSSPQGADGTDFGVVALGGGTVSQTFTVRNDGNATLTLSALAEPAGFTITDNLVSSLAPGASDTFTIRLDSSVAGTKTGQITFTNNDADENPFNFTITGTVASGSGPEVTVLGNGIVIVDGDTSPSMTDGTSFGSVAQGGAGISKTFTVRNDGTSTLTLSGLTEPGGYTITDGLVSSLAPGASDTFTIRLDTATSGTKTGQVSFTNNDSNENPYNFTITGTVTGGGGSGPEAIVLGNGIEIVDGDITPDTADGTDWGVVRKGSSPVVHSFILRNTGGSNLAVGTLQVPAGFTVTNGLVRNLAPGAQDVFSIRLNTGTNANRVGYVRFTNGDLDESPYNFAITGTVSTSVATSSALAAGSQTTTGSKKQSALTTSTSTIPTAQTAQTQRSVKGAGTSKSTKSMQSTATPKTSASAHDQLFADSSLDWLWSGSKAKKRQIGK